MDELTLQAFTGNSWQDIAILKFSLNANGIYPNVELMYNTEYAIEHLQKDNQFAVSLNYPVELAYSSEQPKGWLRFLDDIIPSGASRRYWLKFLSISELNSQLQHYILLKYGTIAPIGNLRIKQSLAEKSAVAIRYFAMADVIERNVDFLEYAQQNGAAAGGATGAGGEAPKLLLRCNSNNQVWIDTYQDTLNNPDHYYLVKFPRGQRTAIDSDILRTEYHYYHELSAMGFNTIDTRFMRLEEGSRYPSLWLPRFDIQTLPNGEKIRCALESVYSVLQKEPGAFLDQETTIRELLAKITHSQTIQQDGDFSTADFIIEWVRRDLLNIAFGNSDNHGRNTALLRYGDQIRLAPIYDFAPMKADPEGIIRTMRWDKTIELGGKYDFVALSQCLADLIEPERLLQQLRQTALQLCNLKVRLIQRGVPRSIIEMPTMGFSYLEQRLTEWKLL
ncbi:serine/threonine-protein kinase HipA [Pasteurella testudinis DSM 23072]|uniref:Serine/threonine-protein kinase HipA n=1 Tax=Pasteurella testudinis DSM 23072 TaxID=1122938 RepID=A0A1W1UZP8_9PAST|nr:HipA domain-containing protein [Pasteurella testudinis]SMB86536.1 serine/threonine-protein kinase HipA [Pasteurella testudinis DSM 23072]SUB51816.1 putative HipA-like protein [Pasteurella testudinis]